MHSWSFLRPYRSPCWSRCRWPSPRASSTRLRRRSRCNPAAAPPRPRSGSKPGLLLSLVKTSTDEPGDRRLEREAQWLRELADVESLEGQVPRVLDEGWRDGHRFLVVSLNRK